MMQQYFLSNQLTLPENWSRHIHCIQSDIAIQTQSAFCWLHCEGKGWKEQARRLAMRNIPTVVVTSSVQMNEMQLAFVLGAKGYCHMSTNTDTANAIVATVLRYRQYQLYRPAKLWLQRRTGGKSGHRFNDTSLGSWSGHRHR